MEMAPKSKQTPDSSLQENIVQIQKAVRQAAEQAGRRFEDITIVAATKMQQVDAINQAISCGISCIGENRVQELLEKYQGYNTAHCSVFFIGHLQQNKVKYIVDKVDMIQSVDSERLAEEIDRQCAKQNRVMNILVEVNLGREPAKSGVFLEDIQPFLKKISSLQHIKIQGLMTVAPICESKKQLTHYFSTLNKEFLDIAAKKLDNVYMDFLSMGMSGDYNIAIACGANMIRVGTALFGARI